MSNQLNIHKDSSLKFVQDAPKLSAEFDAIVKKLEEERKKAITKTKGLFKKSFLKTWLTISGVFVIMQITLGGKDAELLPMLIGIGVMSAALSAIGAGIYTLIKKGTSLVKFTTQLKKELVSKIVKYVNQDLTFFEEGIPPEDFKKMGLFRGSVVNSEDTIKGVIDGQKIVISECKSSSSSTGSSNGASTVYFKGLFVQVQLKNTILSTPLHIVPTHKVERNFRRINTLINLSNQKYGSSLQILLEDRVALDSSLENNEYQVFSKNKSEAKQLITPNFIKIVDFIFNKYIKANTEMDEFAAMLRKTSLFGKLIGEKGIYLSIVEDKLYLALEWNQDLFDPDVFMKNNLEESGIAHQTHSDLIFINQMVKEVNLLNKIDG